MKTATVIGATGATGHHIVEQLLQHPAYARVIVLSRRSMKLSSNKYEEHLVDFAAPEQWSHFVQGDELFSALGTTLKQAGSKTAQYEVDVTYQLHAARAAQKNGVPKLLLVSSPNANSKASSFYLRIKGELDDAVLGLDFPHCILLKPSVIESKLHDDRPAEKLAGFILNNSWRWFPGLGKYRPIRAEQLATAMIKLANMELRTKNLTIELNEIFDFV
jgi:uncharacterized protein YbjT (DUF2867 family)